MEKEIKKNQEMRSALNLTNPTSMSGQIVYHRRTWHSWHMFCLGQSHPCRPPFSPSPNHLHLLSLTWSSTNKSSLTRFKIRAPWRRYLGLTLWAGAFRRMNNDRRQAGFAYNSPLLEWCSGGQSTDKYSSSRLLTSNCTCVSRLITGLCRIRKNPWSQVTVIRA